MDRTREWLETNGAGGFAMGTVGGFLTRRYHGILIASLQPPVARMALLSRVEEEIGAGEGVANLGAAYYPGVISPAGHQFLTAFTRDPFPVWRYKVNDVVVEKRLFLKQGEQTAVLRYRVSAPCRMWLRPFLAFRDYHSLGRWREPWRPGTSEPGVWSFQPYDGAPLLRLYHDAAEVIAAGDWYYHNEYPVEAERGLDFQEDLYSPGQLEYRLEAGGEAFLVASLHDHAPDAAQLDQWETAERVRRVAAPGLRGQLESAAEQFIVRRQDGSPTILAGYPWFTDWGRDAMISLPGLLLTRGELGVAQRIMEGFLDHLSEGMIPNRFPDGGEAPEYNTVDATLWLFQAAWAFQLAGGDPGFLRARMYPAAAEILEAHLRGTRLSIGVDPSDGLLSAGSPDTQLTWMDARVDGRPVTPRNGKPVEINALWYNALRIAAAWAHAFGDFDQADRWNQCADRVRSSFDEQFWNPERGCLYDRIGESGPSPEIRPNQIFAVSLPFPLLDAGRRRAVVDCVTERLLTPVGLRTLDTQDPQYRGRYEGGPAARDAAYHQGAVWPWLLGPYIGARLSAYGHTEENRAFCLNLLKEFQQERPVGCLGSVAEIFDGDEPRRAAGAPAQAWSVAELLRVISLLS